MSIVQNPKLDKLDFLPGSIETLGANLQECGTNFCVYSPSTEHLKLHIFQHEDDREPAISYLLDSSCNKKDNFWHVFVKGLKEGALYLFSTPSNNTEEEQSEKYLLEPYFKQLTHQSIFLSPSLQADKDKGVPFPKCVVVDDNSFDWEDDKMPNIPLSECVIYEAHLKGISINAPTNCKKGTYKGLIELIPYFKKLNITTLELMPIFEFDPHEINYFSKSTQNERKNYWGYSPLSFFAPKATYATEPKNAVNEFKEMVKALHKANIEVVLDVVFNHTAEGGERGHSFCFKAWAEREYYFFSEESYHLNYSGCGNTFNSYSDIGKKIIIDALCYWAQQMHVDGFRFDLASMLMREGCDGSFINTNSSIIEKIEKHPLLQKVKMVAEPWDASGNYQAGNFPKRWLEWNDQYRDTLRRFWLLENDKITYKRVIEALQGSPHIFGKNTCRSINFITCHDGFTLHDLVSYNQKHNEENGEENRDGSNNNLSYNHGEEGATQNNKINTLRVCQIKNMLTSLFLSNGVPMLLMGDECMRSQNGNNNAYCQDNSLSYFDWSLLEKNANLFDFVCSLINLRKKMCIFSIFNKERTEKVDFFDEIGNKIDTKTQGDKPCKFISCLARHSENVEKDCFIILNALSHDVTVRLPAPRKGKWHIIFDTALDIFADFYPYTESLRKAELIIDRASSIYISVAHSATLLVATY